MGAGWRGEKGDSWRRPSSTLLQLAPTRRPDYTHLQSAPPGLSLLLIQEEDSVQPSLEEHSLADRAVRSSGGKTAIEAVVAVPEVATGITFTTTTNGQ